MGYVQGLAFGHVRQVMDEHLEHMIDVCADVGFWCRGLIVAEIALLD